MQLCDAYRGLSCACCVVTEIFQGSIRLPFISRAAWLLTQRDCPDLRCTQAHLCQGTRPSSKVTDVGDVKRYLQVAQIARDGLLVGKHEEPLSTAHECIIIHRQVLDGLLSALHLKLNNPTRHQLKTVMSRYFYAHYQAIVPTHPCVTRVRHIIHRRMSGN